MWHPLCNDYSLPKRSDNMTDEMTLNLHNNKMRKQESTTEFMVMIDTMYRNGWKFEKEGETLETTADVAMEYINCIA